MGRPGRRRLGSLRLWEQDRLERHNRFVELVVFTKSGTWSNHYRRQRQRRRECRRQRPLHQVFRCPGRLQQLSLDSLDTFHRPKDQRRNRIDSREAILRKRLGSQELPESGLGRSRHQDPSGSHRRTARQKEEVNESATPSRFTTASGNGPIAPADASLQNSSSPMLKCLRFPKPLSLWDCQGPSIETTDMARSAIFVLLVVATNASLALLYPFTLSRFLLTLLIYSVGP